MEHITDCCYVFQPIGINSAYYITTQTFTLSLPKKFYWDKLINDNNINDKWSKFLLELGAMILLNASRHIFYFEECGVEIHEFCDSSGKYYGACVFV